MSKISEKINYKKQFNHFYNLQKAKLDKITVETKQINDELGETGVVNYLVNYFFDLEKNTFFGKLDEKDKTDIGTYIVGHCVLLFGYNIDFVKRFLSDFQDKLTSSNEAEIINDDIIKIMKNKTETKETQRFKGIKV